MLRSWAVLTIVLDEHSGQGRCCGAEQEQYRTVQIGRGRQREEESSLAGTRKQLEKRAKSTIVLDARAP